jgi:hypothetical protein
LTTTPTPHPKTPRKSGVSRKAKIWGFIGGLALVVTIVAGGIEILKDVNLWNVGNIRPKAALKSNTPAHRPTNYGSAYDGGWGPSRDTFTLQDPATYAVLNSITNNPVQGDERNFVQVREKNDPNSTYADLIKAKPGDTLVVFAYVDNDAADDLPGPISTIQGFSAQVILQPAIADHSIGVILSAKNAASVWDGCSVVTDEPAQLQIIPDSADYHSAVANLAIDTSEVQDGEPFLLGEGKLDGELSVGVTAKGVELAGGYLTFEVKVLPK